MIQEAKFFRPVGVNQFGKTVYTPCSQNDPGAVAKTLSDFTSSEIQLPPVTMVNPVFTFVPDHLLRMIS